MGDDQLTVGDAIAADVAIQTATALFGLVTGRRKAPEPPDPGRDDALRLLARVQHPLAAATLVIELARGTPLRDDPAWVTEVVRAVDADPRLAGVGARLTRRFVDGAPAGDAPLFDPAMVGALIDAEADNLAQLERDMPALLEQVARTLAALRS